MLEKIQQILFENLNIDAKDVTLESNLQEDLGVDSLDLFEMIMNLEEQYGFEIPTEKLESFKTVGDVVSYLEENNIGG